MSHSSKSFTLIEVVVVMGIMGVIMGGLLASLRQVIEGETILNKMQAVDEETRFIMDAFTQDAEYSELVCTGTDNCYKPTEGLIFSNTLKFNLAERTSELTTGGSLESKYTSTGSGSDYYLKRVLTDTSTNPDSVTSTTLNNTPFYTPPMYRVQLVQTPDGKDNYFITISVIFKVMINNQTVLIPVETSAMSRTFEF